MLRAWTVGRVVEILRKDVAEVLEVASFVQQNGIARHYDCLLNGRGVERNLVSASLLFVWFVEIAVARRWNLQQDFVRSNNKRLADISKLR